MVGYRLVWNGNKITYIKALMMNIIHFYYCYLIICFFTIISSMYPEVYIFLHYNLLYYIK